MSTVKICVRSADSSALSFAESREDCASSIDAAAVASCAEVPLMERAASAVFVFSVSSASDSETFPCAICSCAASIVVIPVFTWVSISLTVPAAAGRSA